MVLYGCLYALSIDMKNGMLCHTFHICEVFPCCALFDETTNDLSCKMFYQIFHTSNFWYVNGYFHGFSGPKIKTRRLGGTKILIQEEGVWNLNLKHKQKERKNGMVHRA